MKIRKDPPVLERRHIPKNQLLIEEGEMGSQAYLIQSGLVSVFIKKDGKEIELTRLQAGQIVGEMAMVSDGPRTASVRAITEVNVIVIGRQQFEEKLKDSDPTIRAIVQMMSKRLSRSNEILLDKKSSLEDLRDTTRVIYQNLLNSLPPNQARTFNNTVVPHLEAFLSSIESFKERYDDRTLD